MVFRKGIDKEGLRINLLLGIGRRSVGIHQPVGTAHLLVEKVFEGIPVSAFGHVQVCGIGLYTVGRREGPQDAGIQDAPLPCSTNDPVGAIYLSVKPALFHIHHTPHPVGKDSMNQLGTHLLFQLFE